MRDHTSLGDAVCSSHGKTSDPRLSILTQDARINSSRGKETAVTVQPEQPGTALKCAFSRRFSKFRFSFSKAKRMRHIRRATIVMAVLAFFPRARCWR